MLPLAFGFRASTAPLESKAATWLRAWPDDNRIERAWLDLHANVPRNHRCLTIEELVVQGAAFMESHGQRTKLNPSLELAACVSESRCAA